MCWSLRSVRDIQKFTRSRRELVGHSDLDLLIDAYKEKQTSGIFMTRDR